jgi:hypothetical protein
VLYLYKRCVRIYIIFWITFFDGDMDVKGDIGGGVCLLSLYCSLWRCVFIIDVKCKCCLYV